MGGFGSGGWKSSGRNTVETCRSLDVDGLSMTGCLRPGRQGSCQWSNGEKVASISLRAEADGLHLSYRVRIGGGDWEDVAETIRIVRVPCRFGGSRAYFMCPGNGNGVECGRRVAKLHQLTRYFLCRHCNRLMYTSQSESQWERAIRRANKMNQGPCSGLGARDHGRYRQHCLPSPSRYCCVCGKSCQTDCLSSQG